MKTRNIKLLMVIMAILLGGMPGIFANDATGQKAKATNRTVQDGLAKQKAAIAAAEKWLALVDAGKYSASWTDAATYFKAAGSAAKWEQALNDGRGSFGKLISRKLKSAVYRTSLPGAPDGQYVVIQYDTAFENKKDAVETVTPMLDKDGQWRVSGYYIK